MTAPAIDQSGSNAASERPRIILLGGAATYRSGAFRAAAQRLGLDVVEAVDVPRAYQHNAAAKLAIDFTDPVTASERVAAYARRHGIDVIVAVDDTATLVAALAGKALGLRHNDPQSAEAARDKIVMRNAFAAAGMPVPWFRPLSLAGDPNDVARDLRYPVVVKPARLSGSRGVIRADDPEAFTAAFQRTRSIALREGASELDEAMLVEEYLPGDEVAVEGLLVDGELQILAMFDKPDPLEGPFFEETIYVTPSRHPPPARAAIEIATRQAAKAIGLREGPVHAELRIDGERVWVIEIAGRSIGGLCSTILEFGAGRSLEELILQSAAGLPGVDAARTGGSVGVMMIPIPRSGLLRHVEGVDEAAKVRGVTGVEITAKVRAPISALPEGASYLGFIFAKGESPDAVEKALRDAHRRLIIQIDPVIPLGVSPLG